MASETPDNISGGFRCPQCGGTYFGRDTAKVNGEVQVLPTVRCHDQHGVKCRWRGVWPPKQEQQK